mmetsp:Transcript_3392/g.9341  ORF Transcript_3392/g.9341 Transcript_3392/m.9341 type:complete len:324 (+) Transcript_3392:191-1162(+)
MFIAGHLPPPKSVSGWMAFCFLPGVLTLTFTSDVILAVLFLRELDDVDPRWEDYHRLVKCTCLSNFITVAMLAMQRLALILSQSSMWVGCVAVVYIAARCFKLIPFYKLHTMVKGIRDSEDRASRDASYAKLWNYWARERDHGWEVRLLKWSCWFAVATFAVTVGLLLYVSSNSVPMGVPPPTTQAAQNPAPLTLAGTCDNRECKVNQHWFLCASDKDCDGGRYYMVGECRTLNMASSMGTTIGSGASGATVSAGVCSVIVPEFLPVCAIIGGSVGAATGMGVVVYDHLNGCSCWDADDPDLPYTPKNELWCAKNGPIRYPWK